MHLIDIDSMRSEVKLDAGKYYIYIIGGWGVTLGSFSIVFKGLSSKVFASSQIILFGLSTFIENKRARKILSVDIPEADSYRLEFKNSNSLRVKKFNLGLLTFILDPIPKQDLKILVSKNNGMLMFK